MFEGSPLPSVGIIPLGTLVCGHDHDQTPEGWVYHFCAIQNAVKKHPEFHFIKTEGATNEMKLDEQPSG